MRGAPNITDDPHARPGVGTDIAINPYPDEPHPDDEHTWKSWWVKKCFDLDKPLTRGAMVWIHQCWRETKARWPKKHIS